MLKTKTHLVILAFISLLVLALQTRNVGFDHGHYGWVSSHVLSQIKHATPSNGFLAYSVPLITEDGKVDYYYFDRYPPFFSAAMNLLLAPFHNDLAKYVDVARTLMNLIFIAMLFVGYGLLNSIFKNPTLSLLTVLTTLGSSTLLFYKDMVHFDQPALLAILVLLYFIARFELEGKKSGLIVAALAAAVIGRGYAAFFVLAVWFALRFLKERKLRHEISLRALVLAVVFAASFLLHNIYREANIRQVPWQETSIVQSASSRLGFIEMDKELERKARFTKVAVLQVEGLYFNILPAVLGGPDQLMKLLRKMGKSAPGIVGLIALLALLIWMTRLAVLEWKKLSPTHKTIGWVMLLSGPAWGLFMRKLTAFHQYTSMYLIPASLIVIYLFYQAIWPRLSTNKIRLSVVTVGLVILFASSLWRVKSILDEHMPLPAEQTADFQNILAVLPAAGAKIYAPAGRAGYIKGAPFALAYYLSDHYISPEAYATHVLQLERPPDEQNLTPKNQFFFLRAK